MARRGSVAEGWHARHVTDERHGGIEPVGVDPDQRFLGIAGLSGRSRIIRRAISRGEVRTISEVSVRPGMLKLV
jgi:hypothetical protein